MPQTNRQSELLTGGDHAPVPEQPATSAAGTPINELLRQLPSESLAGVLRCAERVSLDRRQVIQERQTALRYVYFIESGVASLVARAGGDRTNVEIRTLGIRDFVGLPPLHGVQMSPHRCTMQVAGEALRICVADFDGLLNELPEFRKLLLRYAHDVFVHSAQLVACNTRHTLRQRLSRWLLVASDRLHTDRIDLTHDGLSRAIAVRRAGITTEMGRMEEAGLIRRGRGSIQIVDRDGIENLSCSCHRILRGMSSAPHQSRDARRRAELAARRAVNKDHGQQRFACSAAA